MVYNLLSTWQFAAQSSLTVSPKLVMPTTMGNVQVIHQPDSYNEGAPTVLFGPQFLHLDQMTLKDEIL